MTKAKYKNKNLILAFIILIVVTTSLVAAFGVAIPYWDKPDWTPLKLSPGETKVVSLALQNTGEDDLAFEANIEGGNNIAALEDRSNQYLVSSGETNTPVNIRVTIPENVVVGTTYKVVASFQPVSTAEGEGFFSLTGALTINFPVEVVRETESELYEPKGESSGGNNQITIIAAIILIGLIIIIFLINRKRSLSN